MLVHVTGRVYKHSIFSEAEDPKSNATVVEEADKTANKEPTVHCSGLVSALANSGITQKCTPHEVRIAHTAIIE